MSTDPATHTSDPDEHPADAPGEPSEQELRAAYEAELSRISSTDMILQSAVSLLNVGGYRLGLGGDPGVPPAADRDLEQVRDAIDGVRALIGILERRIPQELGPLRDALSQLQIAYAREAQGAGGTDSGRADSGGADSGGGDSGAQPRQPTEKQRPSATEGKPDGPGSADKPGAGPAESSGRLWVPGR
jgi:hypothetical protein